MGSLRPQVEEGPLGWLEDSSKWKFWGWGVGCWLAGSFVPCWIDSSGAEGDGVAKRTAAKKAAVSREKQSAKVKDTSDIPIKNSFECLHPDNATSTDELEPQAASGASSSSFYVYVSSPAPPLVQSSADSHLILVGILARKRHLISQLRCNISMHRICPNPSIRGRSRARGNENEFFLFFLLVRYFLHSREQERFPFLSVSWCFTGVPSRALTPSF